jgi:hypothetical protein
MADELQPTAPGAPDADLEIRVEAGRVLVCAAGAPVASLSPEAAGLAAERLMSAAEAARGPQAASAPFPPYELVSPHAAG